MIGPSVAYAADSPTLTYADSKLVFGREHIRYVIGLINNSVFVAYKAGGENCVTDALSVYVRGVVTDSGNSKRSLLNLCRQSNVGFEIAACGTDVAGGGLS